MQSQVTLIDPHGEHYYIHSASGTRLNSVTQTIERWFPVFDSDSVISKMQASKDWPKSCYYPKSPAEIKKLWEDNKNEASRLGTLMHMCIENIINNEPVDDAEVKDEVMRFREWSKTFLPFHADGFLASEYRVFSVKHRLAGTIDLLYVNSKGEATIADWKRSKDIEKGYGKALGIFSEMSNTNHSKYCIQANVYRKLFEEGVTEETPLVLHNGLTLSSVKVVNMLLVIIRPRGLGVEQVPVQAMDFTLNAFIS